MSKTGSCLTPLNALNVKPLVEIDSQSGFCHGVVTAINKAEDELRHSDSRRLYCLGDIVHNNEEVERLHKMGLSTISHADMQQLHNVKVLLRAHGEPPSTYLLAQKHNIELVDATCPVVLQLQKRIKATYQSSPRPQIVIYGKPGHAEVNGLVGQTSGEAIVVESPEQISRIDFSRDVALYSQTTMPLQGFADMVKAISERMQPGVNFKYYDTICRQVANRVSRLRDFAAGHDVVLFVSGAKSSNGKVLLNECMSVNPRTHLLSRIEEFDPEWIKNARTIGICGATSTPRWLMEQVYNMIISLPEAEN